MDTDTQERLPHEDGGRHWNDVSVNKRTLRVINNLQQLEGGHRTQPPLDSAMWTKSDDIFIFASGF